MHISYSIITAGAGIVQYECCRYRCANSNSHVCEPDAHFRSVSVVVIDSYSCFCLSSARHGFCRAVRMRIANCLSRSTSYFPLGISGVSCFVRARGTEKVCTVSLFYCLCHSNVTAAFWKLCRCDSDLHESPQGVCETADNTERRRLRAVWITSTLRRRR
jgi:hypothetical protein